MWFSCPMPQDKDSILARLLLQGTETTNSESSSARDSIFLLPNYRKTSVSSLSPQPPRYCTSLCLHRPQSYSKIQAHQVLSFLGKPATAGAYLRFSSTAKPKSGHRGGLERNTGSLASLYPSGLLSSSNANWSAESWTKARGLPWANLSDSRD